MSNQTSDDLKTLAELLATANDVIRSLDGRGVQVHAAVVQHETCEAIGTISLRRSHPVILWTSHARDNLDMPGLDEAVETFQIDGKRLAEELAEERKRKSSSDWSGGFK